MPLNKQMFPLPNDLLSIITSMVFDCTGAELCEDLTFYLTWQKTVPPMFLSAALIDERYFFGVANPMICYHPYSPRKYLRMRPSDIWAATLPALVNMVHPELIRGARTYKGCLTRWTYDCISNRELYYYELLVSKGLKKLTRDHFRRSHPPFFVREALRQIQISSAS